MKKIIGKIAATEKAPTTIDEFYFWTKKDEILAPFDVVRVSHIGNSITFGVIEEISHVTDSSSYLTSYISNDFGDVQHTPPTQRIGLNFVKARVVGNTDNIYTPVLDGSEVGLANTDEIKEALGLKNVKNPLSFGYVEMYNGDDKIEIPVHLNSHFLIGPEGAHLNISGISGLAAKTSYAMFLTKAIQNAHLKSTPDENKESVAFVFFNVKGRDILAIDEPNSDLSTKDKEIYASLQIDSNPFENVTYFYPYRPPDSANTYASSDDVCMQIDQNKAFKYKYIFALASNIGWI